MAEPIYKLFMAKFNAAWNEKSEEERTEILKQLDVNFKKNGGEEVIACYSNWCSEWLIWGVEKYPDIESAQKHANFLQEVGWYKYIAEDKTVLGTKVPEM